MGKYYFEKDGFCYRLLEDKKSDYELMANWRNKEDIAKYFGGRHIHNTVESVREKYLPRINEGKMHPSIIEIEGEPIGYIQYYKVEEIEKFKVEQYDNPYELDMFIASARGKGVGTKTLTYMTEYIFDELKADLQVIMPRSINKRAIRCYEKAGFERQFTVEKGEFFENKWQEGLIMYKFNRK